VDEDDRAGGCDGYFAGGQDGFGAVDFGGRKIVVELDGEAGWKPCRREFGCGDEAFLGCSLCDGCG
jgi:hypothetical protein